MFDSLLEEAGGYGTYQRFLTFGFLLPSMMVPSFSNYAQIFVLMIPPHRCRIDMNDTSWLLNGSQPTTESQCHIRKTSMNSSESTSQDNTPCPYGWIYDYTLMYPTFATENNLVCDNSWKMYSLHSSFFAGAVIGSIVFGWISDKYGRKRAYQCCVVLSLMSDAVTIFSPNIPFFGAARFFSCLGVSNMASTIFVLVMEFTIPRYRLINLMIWSLSYTVFAAIMPWLAFYLRNWRYIMALSLFPSTVCLLLSKFLPESASWLMTKGKWDETADLIHRVAKANGKHILLKHIKAKLEEMKTKEMESSTQQEKDENMTLNWKLILQSANGLFRTPRMRKKTILLIIIRMVCSLCYMGTNLETSNLPYAWYLSFFIGALIEVPANVVCVCLMGKFGRRWANVFFFVIGGLMGIVGGKFLRDTTAILVVSMVSRLCYSAAIDASFTFGTESFPTVVRGRGTSLVRAFGAVASTFLPFIIYMSETDKLLPLVILGAFSLLGGLSSLFLPETAGQPLPHTLDEGEKFGKDQPFCFCPFFQKSTEKAPEEIVTGKTNEAFQEEQV